MMGGQKNIQSYADQFAYERRWRRPPVQPRDWKKYGVAYVAHGVTGFAASFGMIVAGSHFGWFVFIPFLLLTVEVLYRQTIEYLRRHDTPGRDLQDHLTGYVTGLCAAVAVFVWIGG